MAVRSGPTLTDIAKAAGVSPSTVSLILNQRSEESFSPATVERVTETAAALGYQKRAPKPESRKKGKNFKKIAIICPSVMSPYYAILLQGMEQVARQAGYSTCLFTTYWDPAAEAEALAELDPSNTAGIIYGMIPLVPELTCQYSAKIPMVVVGDRHISLNVDMAELNNYNGGVLIANHLIDLGHKHIAYVSTTLDENHSARVKRLEGLRDTFKQRCPEGSVLVRDRKVLPNEELETTGIEHKVGYELTKELLSDERITAFAAVNDMVAYGVLDALADAGKRIPQDYSVSGFDNLYPSRFRSVDLTTVEHSIEKKGRWAARLLLDKLTSPTADSISYGGLMRVEYESFLIRGRTTAAPAKR